MIDNLKFLLLSFLLVGCQTDQPKIPSNLESDNFKEINLITKTFLKQPAPDEKTVKYGQENHWFVVGISNPYDCQVVVKLDGLLAMEKDHLTVLVLEPGQGGNMMLMSYSEHYEHNIGIYQVVEIKHGFNLLVYNDIPLREYKILERSRAK